MPSRCRVAPALVALVALSALPALAACGSDSPTGTRVEHVIEGDWEGARNANPAPTWPERLRMLGGSSLDVLHCDDGTPAKGAGLVRCNGTVSDGLAGFAGPVRIEAKVDAGGKLVSWDVVGVGGTG